MVFNTGCVVLDNSFFDVLLTVHLSIFILVINQLDASDTITPIGVMVSEAV